MSDEDEDATNGINWDVELLKIKEIDSLELDVDNVVEVAGVEGVTMDPLMEAVDAAAVDNGGKNNEDVDVDN